MSRFEEIINAVLQAALWFGAAFRSISMPVELLSAFFGAILGSGIIVVYQARKDRKAEKEKIKTLRNQFFMELNFNRSKCIYLINNDFVIPQPFENLRWEKFIYSKASNILYLDDKLVGDLVQLYSRVDQSNLLIEYINVSMKGNLSGTAENVEPSATDTDLHSSLKNYVKDHLKPKIDDVRSRLEELFKDSGA